MGPTGKASGGRSTGRTLRPVSLASARLVENSAITIMSIAAVICEGSRERYAVSWTWSPDLLEGGRFSAIMLGGWTAAWVVGGRGCSFSLVSRV